MLYTKYSKSTLSFLLIILLTVLISTLVYSEQLEIKLRDIVNNTELNHVSVYIHTEKGIQSYYMDKKIIYLEKTDLASAFTIEVDDKSTQGLDYFQSFDYDIPNTDSFNIYVLPVGTLSIIVKDRLGNVIPNAKISLQCTKMFLYPDQTDEFGTLYLNNVPVGACMLHASYLNVTGTKEVSIEKGLITNTEITLNKSILVTTKDSQENTFPFLIAILVTALIAIVFLLLKSQRLKRPILKAEKTLDSRIMQTLSDKEQLIVNYLSENKGKGVQSRIRHATTLPRTTLTRLIESLEKKGIVNVEKQGKMVKITLTDLLLKKG